MKFMSSIIKHSLQLSRKATTDFSQTNRPNRTEPSTSLNERLNKTVISETPATQTVTGSSSIPEVFLTPVTKGIESSNLQLPQEKADKPEISESTLFSSPESKTPNTSKSVQSSPPMQPLETDISAAISNSTDNIIANDKIKNYPDNMQQQVTDSHNKINTNLSSVTSSTQNSTIDDPEEKILPIAPTQTEGIESPQSTHTEFNSVPFHPEVPTGERQDTDALSIQQADIWLNKKEPHVTVPVNEQATVSALNQTSIAPPLTKSIPSKTAEIPQVRIGNINVLIDDQSAPKPTAKSASTSTSPSIPFGLRGL